MAEFDPSLKKKKKKKVVVDVADGDVGGTGAAAAEAENNMEDQTLAPPGQDLDFTKMKKKKKTKGAAVPDEVGAADMQKPSAATEVAEAGSDLPDAAGGWPDYSYEELLTRVYTIMRDKNPEMASGDKKKFVMKPPQVARAGSKKTAFVNFAEISRLLKRTPKHLLQFLLAELGTSGSIDGSNQLILKGRFQQKHIENVLRKYIKEYVTCHTCKSSDTELQKDTRLFFLQCATCGSRCSVTTIKTGFQAVTTKRKVMRAAQAAVGK